MRHIFTIVTQQETVDQIEVSLKREGPLKATQRIAQLLNTDLGPLNLVYYARINSDKIEVYIEGSPEYSDNMIYSAQLITGLWRNMSIYYQYQYIDRNIGPRVWANQGRISPNFPLLEREKKFDTRYLGCEEDQMLY